VTRGRRDDYRNDYCLGDSWLYRICCRVAMNAGEKFLLDIALVGLICVLVWTGWRRNRRDEHEGDDVEADQD